MAFWVYENVIVSQVTVHDGVCGSCNHGKGVRDNRAVASNLWHGPFGSEDGATSFAASRNRSIKVHKCCSHPTAASGSQTYRRFEVPVEDESQLDLASIFHRRMLEIYTTMRDELDYKPVRFLQSVRRHGGVEHAKRSLRREASTQAGLQRLKDEGRKMQTMESYVIDLQFAPLFTDWEIAEARKRLGQF